LPIQSPKQIEEVHLAVGNALVALLPEEWTEGVLDVERIQSEPGNVEHSLIIRNPSSQPGVVVPSDELLFAVRRLDLLFSQRNHPFKALHFSVRQSAEGEWDFTVSHTYDDAGSV